MTAIIVGNFGGVDLLLHQQSGPKIPYQQLSSTFKVLFNVVRTAFSWADISGFCYSTVRFYM